MNAGGRSTGFMSTAIWPQLMAHAWQTDRKNVEPPAGDVAPCFGAIAANVSTSTVAMRRRRYRPQRSSWSSGSTIRFAASMSSRWKMAAWWCMG